MAHKAGELPALHGAALALTAAILFGLSVPLIRRFGVDTGPWSTAALLYAGAAFVGLLWRSDASAEARVRRSDLSRIGLMAAFGAAIGPFALAWGLQRTSALSGSLALTLEAVFTVLLAAVFYREHLGRRVIAAVALMSAGGVLLVLDSTRGGATGLLGFLAVIGATLAWGVDNTLSRPLAERDPGTVVLLKAAAGTVLSAAFAAVFAEGLPSVSPAIALFVIGMLGYGMSLRFYLLAQRSFGAARTGSVYAAAPFIGAVAALAMGERGLSAWLLGGSVLLLAGVYLHLTERHGHAHVHEPMVHEHAHTHDDAHHTHTHETMPSGPHSHVHTHEATSHAHPHVPDAHHTHRH
jgi:drug/metabolite transporter (DMT)-like permease